MSRLGDLWSLVKSKQTGLLLFTGLAGYASAWQGGAAAAPRWGALAATLALAVAGATTLNMVYDRDIDAVMPRTRRRPLAAGRLRPVPTALAGLGASLLGIAWSFAMTPLYGAVVLAGWLLDVGVYTIWLKRRTAWSVVLGGVAGGMPALAGRVLATGHADATGLLLALAVLLWIPTHIMTFSIKYAADYAAAGVPVFPNRYGLRTTQAAIGLSTVLAALVMLSIIWRLALPLGYLGVSAGLALVLVGLAANAFISPSVQVNLRLFKFASLYMLGSMAVLLVGVA